MTRVVDAPIQDKSLSHHPTLWLTLRSRHPTVLPSPQRSDRGKPVRHHPGRNTVTYSWINAHLQMRSMRVSSLEKDIVTVVPLIYLLEVPEKKLLCEITKFHEKPRHKFDQLDGLRLCLKQIRLRVRMDIKVYFDGKVLLHSEEKNKNAVLTSTTKEMLDNKRETTKTPDARLHWWCNSWLSESVQIKNVTSNWSDGYVLVHHGGGHGGHGHRGASGGPAGAGRQTLAHSAVAGAARPTRARTMSAARST